MGGSVTKSVYSIADSLVGNGTGGWRYPNALEKTSFCADRDKVWRGVITAVHMAELVILNEQDILEVSAPLCAGSRCSTWKCCSGYRSTPICAQSTVQALPFGHAHLPPDLLDGLAGACPGVIIFTYSASKSYGQFIEDCPLRLLTATVASLKLLHTGDQIMIPLPRQHH